MANGQIVSFFISLCNCSDSSDLKESKNPVKWQSIYIPNGCFDAYEVILNKDIFKYPENEN